jgi:hypothetical protein
MIWSDRRASRCGDPVDIPGGQSNRAVQSWPEQSGGGEAVGRIVSARKAAARETRAYEEGNV